MMESLSDYQIYHYAQGTSNKIWGWCRHGDHYWAFWGGVGKACAFKHHGAWFWDLQKLQDQKISKGYTRICLYELMDKDPDWQIRFQERFTVCLLQQTAF